MRWVYLWIAMANGALGFWQYSYVQMMGAGGWGHILMGTIAFAICAAVATEWQEETA